MGNLMACGGMGKVAPAGSSLSMKLIHSNGLVEHFNRPIPASQARERYPNYFLCHASFLRHLITGDAAAAAAFRAANLADNDVLEMGEVYFLLSPSLLQSSDFSQADIAKLLSKARVNNNRSGSHAQQEPLPPLPQPAHDVDGRFPIEESFVQQALAHARLELKKAADSANPLYDGSDPELQNAFTNYVFSRSCTRLWRPPLDTIDESSIHKDIGVESHSECY